MSIQEQRRKAFEEWISDHHEAVKYSRGLSRVVSDERYESMEIEWAFRAYCAALDSVCVELPDIPRSQKAGERWIATNAKDEYRDLAVQAIHAAGVKTK